MLPSSWRFMAVSRHILFVMPGPRAPAVLSPWTCLQSYFLLRTLQQHIFDLVQAEKDSPSPPGNANKLPSVKRNDNQVQQTDDGPHSIAGQQHWPKVLRSTISIPVMGAPSA
ncbi:hypothetical protein TgHK011_004024 [Trichoderma gracile]|nr:hypothetical protein TgHK011_004024 [Trichoderma gracile]